ncbi:MAG: YciI family protein [Ornithinibacter sp.]
MSRHLLLLPAPEADWATLPPEEHEQGMRSHEQFHHDLRDGGHRLVLASPLTPSAAAVSLRPDGDGGVLVTDGPFTESVEQVVGFYLVETDDRAGLLQLCEQFASRGELIEFRDLVGDGEHDHDRAAEGSTAASPP